MPAKTTYNPAEIEKKWQKKWQEAGLYKTPKNPKNKSYILDMYPYPSGASMHVGHLEGYVGTDILSRYSRMKGFDVLHPMGWDSFGLPAENYAIETGIHPEESTRGNIETFRRQLDSTGLSYDWDQEINSSDPDYYKWNQWLFLLVFRRGLAYKAKADVNWCPSCETVLANEQVVDGKCERCETEVIKKKLDQWFLKITDYADRLIDGLTRIDWLDEVKVQQKNWIGKKEGIEITYQVVGPVAGSSRPMSSAVSPAGTRRDALRPRHPQDSLSVSVFTTRPDTNFGATFIVVAPEHPDVLKLTTRESKKAVSEYIKAAKSRSKEDRIVEGRKKTGVFTGAYAINDLNGERMPIWISDFVLMEFGTGAVVGVPGHDKRDFEFAQEFDLPIKRVVVGKDGDTSEITRKEQVQEEEGTMINSDFLDGLPVKEAIGKMMDYLEEKGWGKRVTTYHLRDWLISRQRYWGTPIPMVFCQKCADEGKSWFDTPAAKACEMKNDKWQMENSGQMAGWYPVPEEQLPVLLPKDVDFRPKGQSPITRSKSFQENVACPACGAPARREVDTMDGYVDSSWYFIRFADPRNNKEFASQKSIKDWLPVDVYVGGGHVVQHLLFARFFWKVLFDEGLIDKSLGDEPFLRLRAPGWILGPDSRKMSKRWNNVVTPDDVIPKYGADTLRMYEMFMGPFEAMKPWNLTGVEGMSRFVKRVWELVLGDAIVLEKEEDSRQLYRWIHKTIKRVSEDIPNLRFNTAIAGIMEYVNFLQDTAKRSTVYGSQTTAGKKKTVDSRQLAVDVYCAEWDEAIRTLLLLLAPFAPHMCEELFQSFFANPKSEIRNPKQNEKWKMKNGKFESIHFQPWPEYSPELAAEEAVEIPVQVNGKLRGTITMQRATPLRPAGRDFAGQKKVEEAARKSEKVARYLEGKDIKRVIFVPNRLINFVTSTS